MGIRRGIDGGYFFTRTPNLDQVKELVKEGSAWYPRRPSTSIFDFKDKFKGYEAIIIGKGPSLNNLTAKHVTQKRTLKFCINDSIHIVDKIDPMAADFVVQMDGRMFEWCRPMMAQLILGVGAKGFYSDIIDRVVFNPSDMNLAPAMLSAQYCLHFAKLMGCVCATMMCFDGSINGQKTYAAGLAPVIKNASERRAGDRFERHGVIIEAEAKKIGLPIAWVLP